MTIRWPGVVLESVSSAEAVSWSGGGQRRRRRRGRQRSRTPSSNAPVNATGKGLVLQRLLANSWDVSMTTNNKFALDAWMLE